MSFIIEINGKDITSIEDLRENFDCGILLNYKDNFEDWLSGWDYYDEAAQVRELPPDLSDNAWLEEIAQILSVPVTVCEQAANRYQQKIAEEKAQAAEEQKRLEEEKQREAERQRATSVPITRDNIAIEIIKERIQTPPEHWSTPPRLKFIQNDIYLFDHWGSKIIKSEDYGQSWQCQDICTPGEIQYIGEHWVSLSDGWTLDKGETDFMTSVDGCEWEVKYLKDVYGGPRKILFDGDNFILITQNSYETGTIFKEKHYYYKFYSSKDLKTWSKIGELSGDFCDMCFVDGYFHLLDQSHNSKGTSYAKAKTIQELIDKNTKKISEKNYRLLYSYSNGRFILKGDGGFALINEKSDITTYSGVAVFVEGLVFCCDDDGDIWVSENGVQHTWRKLGKTPFKVSYLAYKNKTLVMSGYEFGNYDNAKVCVAKVYAKEDTVFRMPVDDATLEFGRGFCCTGRVKQGKIKIGDIVNICDKSEKILTSAKILEINQYGKTCEFAKTGDIVGICLPGTDDLYRVFAGKEGKDFILKI